MEDNTFLIVMSQTEGRVELMHKRQELKVCKAKILQCMQLFEEFINYV
jgi:hypothetical protein